MEKTGAFLYACSHYREWDNSNKDINAKLLTLRQIKKFEEIVCDERWKSDEIFNSGRETTHALRWAGRTDLMKAYTLSADV
ncbi:MAG: hypothetical protein IPM38_16425 [Ignavibacteria bacterium]|nr:hypothetical protein [Ignavibacteria bacterium]